MPFRFETPVRELTLFSTPTQLLRRTLFWSRTFLYIPLLCCSIQVFDCESLWSRTGTACYSGGHVASFLFITAINLAFISFCIACGY